MVQSETVRSAIAAMGSDMGPEVVQQCAALFSADQQALSQASPAPVADLAYGPDPRHRLDAYPSKSGPAPVIIFVHGGGFTRGDKSAPGSPYNAHIGRVAARHGLMGVVMNYRLAPEHKWPSGAEDIAAAVAWTQAHAGEYGGDPERIFLMGTSAGAAHVAGYLQRHSGPPEVRGAILLSGIYQLADTGEPHSYFGDPARSAEQSSLEGVAASDTPLLVACAEFDPLRFQKQTMALLQRRLDLKGRLPAAFVGSGHNHFSLAMHLGGPDERLLHEILGFIRNESA